jgi:hypothetical protein
MEVCAVTVIVPKFLELCISFEILSTLSGALQQIVIATP